MPGRPARTSCPCPGGGLTSTRRPRSTTGWPRSRECSRSGPCGTRILLTQCRKGGRHAGYRPASATACSRTSPAGGPVGAAAEGTAAAAVGAGPAGGRGAAGQLPDLAGPGDRGADALLRVADADIGGRWVQVTGKGSRERRVRLDPGVGADIQAYLLAEWPETGSGRMFIVAKGPHRGQPLTPEGLRRIFRYHREIADVPAGHRHALRHTFGTALAEAGVDAGAQPLSHQAVINHPKGHPARATSGWQTMGDSPIASANCAGWAARRERLAAHPVSLRSGHQLPLLVGPAVGGPLHDLRPVAGRRRRRRRLPVRCCG